MTQATGLKRTGDELNEARETIENTQNELAGHQDRLRAKKEEKEKLRADLQSLMRLDQLETEIKTFAVKACWADHRDAQAVADQVQLTADERQAELDAALKSVAAAEETDNGALIQQATQRLADLQGEHVEAQDAVNKQSDKVKEVVRQISAGKADLAAMVRGKAERVARLKNVIAAVSVGTTFPLKMLL